MFILKTNQKNLFKACGASAASQEMKPVLDLAHSGQRLPVHCSWKGSHLFIAHKVRD